MNRLSEELVEMIECIESPDNKWSSISYKEIERLHTLLLEGDDKTLDNLREKERYLLAFEICQKIGEK